MYIKPTFINQSIYHLYNRGVAKQPIFEDERDYQRLLTTFSFYLERQPPSKLSMMNSQELKKVLGNAASHPIIEVLGYCLMPNHFHLIARQIENAGISFFMRRSLDSYTRYYNARHNRVGPIFQGKFKAVLIENDEQLIHLSRYVHLNPFVEDLIDTPNSYRWSSYKCYLSGQSSRICSPDFVVKLVGSAAEYRKFVTDYASYAQSIATIKHSLINEF